MVKQILICFLFLGCYQTAFAGTFFNVSATGPAAQISMTICLNGKGPLSCQNYTASAINLSITSTIPNHTYPNAGIKINTPGYSLTGCSMSGNGYCLFSVSNTQAAAVSVVPPAVPCLSQADVIVFSPTVTRVNNPTGGSSNPPQQFTINMSMCNSQGQTLLPSASNPIHVDVYGAPNGVISPTSTTSDSGTVTFTYSGQSFPNNISINAWIRDTSNNGAALGVTQVLQQNTPSCTYGSTSYQVPLVETLPDPLKIHADVGYDANSPTTTFSSYTIDTGSLGVVVPVSDLPNNSNVIGPGAAGIKYYDSSGNTYAGNYYLAPVRVKLASGVVMTQPIMVLGINRAYCTGPTTKSCYSAPPAPTLHYMGVGFSRNSTTTGDLFDSPTANAFLHLTNTSNGTDVTPGYYLTPHDVSPTGLTLGITNTTGYNLVNLTANSSVPGDFNPQAGCFTFPSSPTPNQFCGTALLDVGIDSMFIDLPRSQWPHSTHNSRDEVPAGVNMEILMGATSSPAMSYSFTTVNGSSPPADSPTPTLVSWIDSTATGLIFVNTGRRPLYDFNYLYNGQCGQVGFKALP